MWRLEQNGDVVEVTQLGGRIARWRSRGVDVFKPMPDQNGELDGLPLWGCFPMAPFCNRLMPAALPSGSGAVGFDINWPRENLALHGTVFDTQWTERSHSQHELHIENEVRAARGSLVGVCRQQIALIPDGLTLALSFRLDGVDHLEAGVGFHPWFPSPARVRFNATHRLDADAANHVTGAAGVNAVALSSKTDEGHDLCYTGLEGPVLLHHDGWPAELVFRTSAPCLHVFVSDGLDTVCVEPVSHAPNAAHNEIAKMFGPMNRLSRGQVLRAEFTMSWADGASTD